MSGEATPTGGRLAGKKSASYVRAVNEPEARASRYTARYMLASDIAYVLSAAELGLTPRPIAKALLAALLDAIGEIGHVDTSLPPGDIVAQREAWLAKKVGKDEIAWLHLGRNRGESLRCFLPRLYFREMLFEERRAIARLLTAINNRAAPTLEAIAPNYHHLQHSGLTTLGDYLLSWSEIFRPHLDRLDQVARRLDKGPSVPGSRPEVQHLYDRVTKRLGFTSRARLRRDGIWTHAQFTEPFFALVMVAVDIARLAQDLRIWMTPEFGFFELADEHAGGSSALPHAKVPFGLQSVIGGATIAVTRLAGEMATAINPSEGSEALYHSETLYRTAADIIQWTEFMADMVAKGDFKLEELKRKATLDYAGSSEAHDRLTFDFGVPFRTGHRILGAMVRAHYYKEPAPDLRAMIKAETGRDVAVDQQEIMDIVLGHRIWPTTFDFDGLRTALAQSVSATEQAMHLADTTSPVERAIEELLDEARGWLTNDK